RWYEESTTSKNWQRMIDEGIRAQRDHISARGLPEPLGKIPVIKILRRLFQVRRVAKRLLTHGRIH
ncbi:MAG: hypothetical protein NWT04_13615, partial [Verrucomicrobiales bacterium]|nr:hypothetical protein [Verrucomicrobiales bacterium]